MKDRSRRHVIVSGEEFPERCLNRSAVKRHRRSEVIHQAAARRLRRRHLASERARTKTSERIQLVFGHLYRVLEDDETDRFVTRWGGQRTTVSPVF